MKDEMKEIKRALFKRAIGYETNEIVEEYSLDEPNGEKLTKKKKTIKSIPPDITATKLYLDLNQTEGSNISSLTDKELDEEINKIISKLLVKDKEKNGK